MEVMVSVSNRTLLFKTIDFWEKEVALEVPNFYGVKLQRTECTTINNPGFILYSRVFRVPMLVFSC